MAMARLSKADMPENNRECRPSEQARCPDAPDHPRIPSFLPPIGKQVQYSLRHPLAHSRSKYLWANSVLSCLLLKRNLYQQSCAKRKTPWGEISVQSGSRLGGLDSDRSSSCTVTSSGSLRAMEKRCHRMVHTSEAATSLIRPGFPCLRGGYAQVRGPNAFCHFCS